MSAKIDLGLPVDPEKAVAFEDFLDAERLIRLHPHWIVEKMEYDGDSVSARLMDHASEEPLALVFRLAFPARHEMLITFSRGPAESIRFFAERQRLHVTIAPEGERSAGEDRQDLTLWLQSIRQYLRLYLKTTPYTRFFRLLMNGAVLKMTPSQRKICLMLYRFTLLEIVVILIVVIGYITLGRTS